MVAMKGWAWSWFQWWASCIPNPKWVMFWIAVIRRFQPSKILNPFEILLGLRQEGSIQEFRDQFETYAGALIVGHQKYLKEVFLKGLREEVREKVKLHPLILYLI